MRVVLCLVHNLVLQYNLCPNRSKIHKYYSLRVNWLLIFTMVCLPGVLDLVSNSVSGKVYSEKSNHGSGREYGIYYEHLTISVCSLQLSKLGMVVASVFWILDLNPQGKQLANEVLENGGEPEALRVS